MFLGVKAGAVPVIFTGAAPTALGADLTARTVVGILVKAFAVTEALLILWADSFLARIGAPMGALIIALTTAFTVPGFSTDHPTADAIMGGRPVTLITALLLALFFAAVTAAIGAISGRPDTA